MCYLEFIGEWCLISDLHYACSFEGPWLLVGKSCEWLGAPRKTIVIVWGPFHLKMRDACVRPTNKYKVRKWEARSERLIMLPESGDGGWDLEPAGLSVGGGCHGTGWLQGRVMSWHFSGSESPFIGLYSEHLDIHRDS